MRGSRKFFQRGSNFFYDFFFFFIFLLGERGYNYHNKLAVIGSPAECHLNGVSLVGRWWPNTECWLVSFVVLQRIRTNIAKKPYIFVTFEGRGPELLSHHLWIRTWLLGRKIWSMITLGAVVIPKTVLIYFSIHFFRKKISGIL